MVPNLLSQVLANLFVRHEFKDVAAEVAAESAAALADPATASFDALHRAAFRGGLANPVFADPSTSKSITRTKVTEYLSSVLGPDSLAVVGAGVNHDDLVALVDAVLRNADLPTGSAPAAPSTYHGGEVRIAAPGASRYLLATEGVAHSSADYAAALVLKGLLGSGEARVKYSTPSASSGSGSPLAKLSGPGVKVSAFNTSYSDTGLFGIEVVADKASDVKAAVEGAVAALKAAASGVSAADLARAKKAAVVDLESAATREGILHSAATQVLATGTFESPADLAGKIEAVSADQVAKVCFETDTCLCFVGKLLELKWFRLCFFTGREQDHPLPHLGRRLRRNPGPPLRRRAQVLD